MVPCRPTFAPRKVHMSFVRPSVLSAILLASACDLDGEPASAPIHEPVDVEPRCLGCWGGPLTNTHGLNGLSVSALDTTGEMYDGWRLDSVALSLDGGHIPIYGVHTKNGVLHGTDSGGYHYAGDDFVGSIWSVRLEDTEKLVQMQAVAFTPDGSATRYTFVGGSSPGNDKGFTCALDPDTGEYSAVLFDDLDVDPDDGTHFARASTIYFGCLSGAVGKAALWGYSPWNTDHATHQTATRAVRADYCGDGTPYTVQGTPLQLADVFQVNHFVADEKVTEAMWGPDGAECIKVPRLGYDPAEIECNGETLPFCSVEDTLEEWPYALLWTKIWL